MYVEFVEYGSPGDAPAPKTAAALDRKDLAAPVPETAAASQAEEVSAPAMQTLPHALVAAAGRTSAASRASGRPGLIVGLVAGVAALGLAVFVATRVGGGDGGDRYDAIIARMGRIADKLCACKDTACADGVMKGGSSPDPGGKPSKAQMEKAKKIAEKIAECQKGLIAAGGPVSRDHGPVPPAAASARAATTPAAAGLTLPLVAYNVGLHWTKTDDITMEWKVTAGDKKIPVTSKRHYRDELEVVAVDAAGIVTKMKASYPERQDSEDAGGKRRDKASSLTGKSYVVSSVAGRIEATLADGGAVTPEELTELTHDLDVLGKPQPMDKIMASRTWKVGEVYTLTPNDLAQLAAVRDEEAPNTTAMTLTLRQAGGGKATFDMRAGMATEGKAVMTIAMTGAVTVDIKTGRPTAVKMTGPVSGTASSMPLTGTLVGKITYDYTAR